jgi:hypothetical protein
MTFPWRRFGSKCGRVTVVHLILVNTGEREKGEVAAPTGSYWGVLERACTRVREQQETGQQGSSLVWQEVMEGEAARFSMFLSHASLGLSLRFLSKSKQPMLFTWALACMDVQSGVVERVEGKVKERERESDRAGSINESKKSQAAEI